MARYYKEKFCRRRLGRRRPLFGVEVGDSQLAAAAPERRGMGRPTGLHCMHDFMPKPLVLLVFAWYNRNVK